MSTIFETLSDDEKSLTISKAASIAGIDRSNLYRGYINKGVITVSTKTDGSKFIAFDELSRVFGLEQCLQGILKIRNSYNTTGKSETHHSATVGHDAQQDADTVFLKVENATLKAKLEGLERLLSDREATITEQREQLRQHFSELQISRRLLEDKHHKNIEPLQQDTTMRTTGLLSRIVALFTG